MKVVNSFELANNNINPIKLEDFKSGKNEHPLVNIYNVEQSKILGFGGAFTETAGYNYSLLNKENKQKVLELLFGKTGLNYNLCRICIGSSDFYLKERSYQNNENDTFSIEEDKKYVIPFILDAIEFRKGDIKFLASPWSPPSFMKDNNERLHGGKLKETYYEKYAEYICNFIKEYKKLGINIDYLSIQNEPKAIQTWESCVFDSEDEVKFAKVLKKTLEKHNISTKLICWDHNKERLFERANACFKEKDLFDGVGYHWYSGNHFDAISLVRKIYPDKLVFLTEFCKSQIEDATDSSYSQEYVNGIRCGSMGFIEWNLLTDTNGGPFHNRKGGCLAPLTLLNDNEVVKSTNYNQTWIYSHFILEGAVSLFTSSYDENVKVSAVKNPDNSIIINILNNHIDGELIIYMNGEFLPINVKKNGSYVIVLK